MTKKTLVVCRGVPGSGKSYLAKQIKKNHDELGIDCQIFSTDDYWYVDEEHPYQFDFAKIGQAHRWNQKRTRQALHNDVPVVIVDNTNTTWKEVKEYAQMAVLHGYKIDILEPKNYWSKDVDECFKRNTHGVPREVIQKMLDRFQDRAIIEFEIRQLELNKRMSQ